MAQSLDISKILIYLSSPALVIGLSLWGISTCSGEEQKQAMEINKIQENRSTDLHQLSTNQYKQTKGTDSREEKSIPERESDPDT